MKQKIKIEDLKPNDNNPRYIKDIKFVKLLQSIKQSPSFMEMNPIKVDENMLILGGNMRFKACKHLGWTEVPFEVFTREMADENNAERERQGIDVATYEDQCKEYIIKDNVGFGEWDFDMLANQFEIETLEDWGLDLLPFEDEVLEAEEDDFNEAPPEQPVTILGDLYEIGEHRLLCGDSTDSDQVENLMNGQKIDLVFTSPPYNSGDVAMRGGGKFAFGKTGAKTLYENFKDDKTPEEYFDFCIGILNNISLYVNDLHSVFWNVSYNANSRDNYGKIVFSDINPFSVKETIIWNKGVAIPITSEGILSRNSEFIFLMSKGKKYLTNQKIGENSVYWNTWNISSSGSQKNEHKACFPVELPFKAIEDFSKSDSLIYEPFMGSGTTMVASHQLKRKCYGMELDPKYCDVIVKRMLKLDPSISVKRNGVDCKQYFN